MTKKQVPIENGLFTLPSSKSDEPNLIGSKCRNCGEVFFPRQVICSNCSGEDLYEIPLSRRGKVFSSTVLRYGPPLYKGPLPIPHGRVELAEGVIVPTPFTDCDVDETLKIGTEVEMVIEKFGEDEEGNEIITYKFKPV
ncbi:Zn-ribbon domain-containing OB-fold protein [Chloroflexota bacterium]